MSDELSPDLQRLLAFERQRPAPEAEVEARVLERLVHSAMTLPLAPVVPPPTGASAASAGLKLAGAKLVVSGLVTAVVSAGAGAALHATIREPEVRMVEVVRHLPAPEVPEPSAEAFEPAQTEPEVAPAGEVPRQSPAPPKNRSRPAPPPVEPAATEAATVLEKDRALASERLLLEQARTSLARQKPEEALRALSEHELRFSAGQLQEEREGLRVLALFANGDLERARKKAAEFRARYPQSVMIRAIRHAEQRGQ